MTDFRPILRTIYRDRRPLHPDITVQFEAGQEPIRCCGASWCNGDDACGLPALVIPATGDTPELKTYSVMTACGPVMQRWRLEWTGHRVEIPEEHRADFCKRYWQ